METRTINLRDLPEDVVRRAKAYAALSGMTLKQFVIDAIEKAMQNDLPLMTTGTARAFHGRVRKSQGRSRKGDVEDQGR